MEARTYVVRAKVPLKKTVQLRISDGPGMMQGGTSVVVDLETGTKKCDLIEGQVLQGFVDKKIIDTACLGCIVSVFCLATAK